MIRAWSERATGDPALNKDLRNHLMFPIEVPVGAVLAAGAIILCVSRVLLAVSEAVGTGLIIGLAVLIFAIAFLLANRPELKRSVVVGLLLIGGVLLIGGGIAGGIYGTHNVEKRTGKEGASAVLTTTGPGRGTVTTDAAGPSGH